MFVHVIVGLEFASVAHTTRAPACFPKHCFPLAGLLLLLPSPQPALVLDHDSRHSTLTTPDNHFDNQTPHHLLHSDNTANMREIVRSTVSRTQHTAPDLRVCPASSIVCPQSRNGWL